MRAKEACRILEAIPVDLNNLSLKEALFDIHKMPAYRALVRRKSSKKYAQERLRVLLAEPIEDLDFAVGVYLYILRLPYYAKKTLEHPSNAVFAKRIAKRTLEIEEKKRIKHALELKKHRDKNFQVKLVEIHESQRDAAFNEREFRLMLTGNGSQWQALNFLESEYEQVLDALITGWEQRNV